MIDRLLTFTATVQKRSTTQNDFGEMDTSWSDSNTYPTRMSQSASAREVNGVYQKSFNDVVFYFQEDADITKNDRISFEGGVYEVINVKTARGRRRSHHLEVQATIVSNE